MQTALMFGSAVIMAGALLALSHRAIAACKRVDRMTDEHDLDRIDRLQNLVDQQRIHLFELGEIIERDSAQARALSDANDRLVKQLDAYRSLRFPTMLRKMWTGAEVAEWLDREHERISAGH